MRTKNSRILILILVLMLLLPLTGCDRHDMYVIQNYFRLWALAHGYMDPASGQIYYFSLLMDITGGKQQEDPHMQTAHELETLSRDITHSENLAREGFDERDEEKIQEAIQLRPTEYSFYARVDALRYFTHDEYELGNIRDEFNSYLGPNELFGDYISTRHMVDRNIFFGEGYEIAKSHGAYHQRKYLDQLYHYSWDMFNKRLLERREFGTSLERQIYETHLHCKRTFILLEAFREMLAMHPEASDVRQLFSDAQREHNEYVSLLTSRVNRMVEDHL